MWELWKTQETYKVSVSLFLESYCCENRLLVGKLKFPILSYGQKHLTWFRGSFQKDLRRCLVVDPVFGKEKEASKQIITKHHSNKLIGYQVQWVKEIFAFLLFKHQPRIRSVIFCCTNILILSGLCLVKWYHAVLP